MADKIAQPTLPRTDLFDVLPALHELLSRIDHQVSAESAADLATTADHEDAAYADLPPLEPRDLPGEVLNLKTKIRRTVRELEKLDDMDRSVEQQEQEIVALQRRIEQQRALLERLNQAAKAADV